MSERFRCGVIEDGVPCGAGYVTDPGPPVTTVECDTHNSRTTHDTIEREAKEQQIIRPQDKWRQHGLRR